MDEGSKGKYLARNKIGEVQMTLRLIIISLLFLIISGCSWSKAANHIETDFNQFSSDNTPANIQKIQASIFEVRKKPIGEYDEPCQEYILRKVAAEKAGKSQTVELDIFDSNGEFDPLDIRFKKANDLAILSSRSKVLSPKFKNWLEGVQLDRLVVYEVQHEEKKVLAFRSIISGATGISGNYSQWFIQSDNYSIIFESLSENPSLIFWDKNDALNYYSVDYSQKFPENQNGNNTVLNLFRYKISPNGESQLVSEERNVKCE